MFLTTSTRSPDVRRLSIRLLSAGSRLLLHLSRLFTIASFLFSQPFAENIFHTSLDLDAEFVSDLSRSAGIEIFFPVDSPCNPDLTLADLVESNPTRRHRFRSRLDQFLTTSLMQPQTVRHFVMCRVICSVQHCPCPPSCAHVCTDVRGPGGPPGLIITDPPRPVHEHDRPLLSDRPFLPPSSSRHEKSLQ